MSNATSNTFGGRLIEAMEYQGITDPDLQAERIAKVCQVTDKTARKYLQSTSQPCYAWRIDALTEYLQVTAGWLLHGGISFDDMRCLEYIRSLTPWERHKTWRLAVRLMNDCPKARRLTSMENAGQISRFQLLASM